MPKRKPNKKGKKPGRRSAGADRRRDFRARTKKQKQRRQSKSIFKPDLDNVNFWKCEEGQHVIDIIPYFTGENDPLQDAGENAHSLEVYVHRDVGDVEGQMAICLKETFGEPCPICEHRQQLRREGDADEDLLKELTPSRYARSIFNIVCYDTRREEEKGVQVWHTSEYLFTQHLMKLAEGPVRRGSDRPESFVNFACPVDGKSVSFTTEGTKMNTKHLALQFLDRDYEIDDELLDEAHTLDDLIDKPTYEQVYKLYWGEDMEEGEGEGDDDDEEEDRPRRGRGRRTASAPKRRRTRDEDDEEEDDDEDDDGYADDECPHGGVFGDDCNNLDECEECDAWDECYAAAEEDDEEEEDERPRRRSKPKPKPKRGGKKKKDKPRKKLRRR